MKAILCKLLLCSLTASSIAAEQDRFSWPKADPAAMTRWQSMRFGMFIHWGPVSLTGKEIGWSRGAETPIEVYDSLYKSFNPTNFNADAWVSAGKSAGMKYVVFTTKHHDGFCMWDTKQTSYNIMNSPFGRDVVKELAAACKRQGLAFGTYYSTCDWYHPDFPLTSPGGKVRRPASNLDAYTQYLLDQIRELITNYGPLLTLWNDVPQEFQGRGAKTIAMVRQLQPDIVVNNRTGDGGDYDTPEQRIGAYQDNRPWETCMTICRQWSWKPKDELKSLKQCINNLQMCASGDGNLLLNVAPGPDGVVEERQVQRLKEIGQWLEKNGESIYSTRGGPWKPAKGIGSTRRGNIVYLHLIRSQRAVEVPDLPLKLKSAKLLDGREATVEQKEGKLRVSFDSASTDLVAAVVRMEFSDSVMSIPAITWSPEIKAAASSVYSKQSHSYGPQFAFDDDPETRWATDAGTKQAWISADFAQPCTVSRIKIDEAIEERITSFEFQYQDGLDWKTVFSGKKVGHTFDRKFPPIKARLFRLNILDATEGPTINSIEIMDK